jgi:UDP-N-acetylglucosamine 2-epimerase (non-hydrolysing)
VDDARVLGGILDAFSALAEDLPLCWPVHPRTRNRLEEFGLRDRLESTSRIHRLPPCGYLDFLGLMSRARLILTDSGGIQEEACVLKVPVVTMRENTERPSTVECGGNILAGADPQRILAGAREMLGRDPGSFGVPPLWDGRSGERIAAQIVQFLEGGATL